jgi:hypothetical protein
LGEALPSTISAKDKSSLFDRFVGTTTSSESSSACMLIFGLRLHEPVRHAKPDTDEVSQVPYKGRLHVHGVSDCARLLVAKPFRREDVAFSSSNWIGASKFDPFRSSIPSRGLPCERFKLSLAASPCITRGRGGWLGLTP